MASKICRGRASWVWLSWLCSAHNGSDTHQMRHTEPSLTPMFVERYYGLGWMSLWHGAHKMSDPHGIMRLTTKPAPRQAYHLPIAKCKHAEGYDCRSGT